MRRRWWMILAALAAAAVAVVLAVTAVNAGPRHSSEPDAEEHESVVVQKNATTGSCGVERWAVKTGTDTDASLINLQSTTSTTISSLDSLTKPSTLPASSRVKPTETTVFRLNATLTQYKLEADSDYHLVLSDGSGNTMIAEIPDPACVGSGSPLASSITKSRATFDAKYSPTGSFQTANTPVTVTGVGFFDFLHGQTGVAPNGIELHSVLDIQFGTGTSGTVTLTTPGTQTSTVGQAASLQLSATDTAGGTLGYSATGLPVGLSLNTATGLISGTPTTAGTSTVKVTATDSTGPSASITFTWTVNTATGNTVTVTNPGNQAGTVGTAVSLQIGATDSASSQTLTYSSSGLPAGLSISSTTGLITGTPTAAATSSTTVTATDSTGATGSTGFTWTITAGGSCTATQLLGNPGFETGTLSPWTGTSGVVNSDTTSEPPHAGSWDAWLDGYGSAHTDTLAQAVTLPSGCGSYALSFWLHVDTAETSTTTAYDTLKVQVLNSSGTVLATLATYSNLNANSGYTQHSYDLSPYKGQSITVKFTGTEDSQLQTSFVLDDTALNVS
ncbi:putative Ig domain-containing protein [Streptacidiphilus sp. EB103A]|uniref:putative Ig domain-containing protein n=1 Tax=Streptacidiphilus sp. EB103A TaxID=3156275 RepID=UPI003516DB3A